MGILAGKNKNLALTFQERAVGTNSFRVFTISIPSNKWPMSEGNRRWASRAVSSLINVNGNGRVVDVSCECPEQSRVQYFWKRLAPLFINHYSLQYIFN